MGFGVRMGRTVHLGIPRLQPSSLSTRHALPSSLRISTRLVSTEATAAPITQRCTSQALSTLYIQKQLGRRHLRTTSSMSTPTEEKKKDWSATQYLKFGTQRTRPVYDLVAQITPLISSQNPRIFDLGCGPGNSTQVLSDAFPGARITGVDTSADMLAKANATFSGGEGERVDFAIGDVSTWTAPAGETADLLFSNAVFHWLRSSIRIATLVRLFESLRPGGVLAFQVPDNYHQPSHASMRATASLPGRPWSPFFADTKIGSLEDDARPDLDPIEPPSAWIDALAPLARDGSAGVDVWRTEYQHVLADAGGIVEWVKGTGLQPFLHRIGDEEGAKEAFLKEYERALGEAYRGLRAGGVCLGYPRLFVVAVRGEGGVFS